MNGTVINGFKILDKKVENNRSYYYCECPICHENKWIRSDSLKRIKACGCLQSSSFFKPLDLTKKHFGKLEVLRQVDGRNKDGRTIWECKCTCGNIVNVPADCLQNSNTTSCGCYRSEICAERGSIKVQELIKRNIVCNTNIPSISRKTPIKSNKSGVTGVFFDNSKQKWVANIEFQTQRYRLGYFENKDEAIKARKEAEEKFFGNFLEWYEEYKKGENKNGNS